MSISCNQKKSFDSVFHFIGKEVVIRHIPHHLEQFLHSISISKIDCSIASHTNPSWISQKNFIDRAIFELSNSNSTSSKSSNLSTFYFSDGVVVPVCYNETFIRSCCDAIRSPEFS